MHSLNIDTVDLYLYSDGSPQWRGVELLASSIDVRIPMAGGEILRHRRLLPAISINMSMFGVKGKTITLLWQLWLMFGPSYANMRAVLARIRSLTLDFGTEHRMVDSPDILPAFFRMIGADLPPRYVLQDFLFVRALLQPGMRHSVDRLIKKGCLSQPWFPEFLDCLKAIVSFCRDRKSDIKQSLTKDGYPAVADMVGTAKLAPFTKWRWGNLKSSSRGILNFYRSLKQTLNLAPFRKRAQDPSLIRRVAKAFDSDIWCGPHHTL